MGLVRVSDESTRFCRYRFLNSQLCLWLGCIQIIVCGWGVAQHMRSYAVHRVILRCDFENGTLPLEAADAVIFDVGLFYSVWGIKGCVAEYLDGGMGRLVWCSSHLVALLVSLPFAFKQRPKPYFLWPLLVLQSVYGVGLLILLLAALPRILPLFMEPHAAPLAPIGVYVAGTTLNFFLLYVYWHWYWHVTSLWNTVVRVRFGEVVRNANNRSRRDKPMLPREPMPGDTVPNGDVSLTLCNGSGPPRLNNSSIPIMTSSNGGPPTVCNGHLKLGTTTAPSKPTGTSAISLTELKVTSLETKKHLSDRRVSFHLTGDTTDSEETTVTPESLGYDTPDTPTVPQVILATKLFPESAENRYLRAQEETRTRRRLPPTPDEPMYGQIKPRPVAHFPQSRI